LKRRFYFHVVGNTDTYKDQEGTVLSGSAVARLQAAIIAAELAQDGENYRGWVVHVVNEDGDEVVRLPIVKNIGDLAADKGRGSRTSR
jgi:hypothetical protein